MARCLRCRREFERHRAGHLFCSSFCRHRGERRAHESEPVDQAVLNQLFDEARAPNERVRPDDWHPLPEFAELDRHDTVGRRRDWYLQLVEDGRL
jgi:hypothetical protein